MSSSWPTGQSASLLLTQWCSSSVFPPLCLFHNQTKPQGPAPESHILLFPTAVCSTLYVFQDTVLYAWNIFISLHNIAKCCASFKLHWTLANLLYKAICLLSICFVLICKVNYVLEFVSEWSAYLHSLSFIQYHYMWYFPSFSYIFSGVLMLKQCKYSEMIILMPVKFIFNCPSMLNVLLHALVWS